MTSRLESVRDDNITQHGRFTRLHKTQDIESDKPRIQDTSTVRSSEFHIIHEKK